MAFTYIESGKHLIGERVEGFTATGGLVRLCSAQPVSSTSLNELSGNGYSPREVPFNYNPHTEVMENGSQLVFGPATANWDPITHILVSSESNAEGGSRSEDEEEEENGHVSSGIFYEVASAITVQSGDSLVLEPGAIKIGLSRIYDGVGAAANFITPADANVLFAGSNFVNTVLGGGTNRLGDLIRRGQRVYLKLLTGEPTLTDTKETVPDFPAGVEILLSRVGSDSSAFFWNPHYALYGPFVSGVTFTHFAIGHSQPLQNRNLSVSPNTTRNVTPQTHETGLFNIYGYDTLSSPIVIPPNQRLYIPPLIIQTSQAALT